LKKNGADVLVMRTYVGEGESVKNLACKSVECFGAFDILLNNAGVTSAPGPRYASIEEGI